MAGRLDAVDGGAAFDAVDGGARGALNAEESPKASLSGAGGRLNAVDGPEAIHGGATGACHRVCWWSGVGAQRRRQP